MDYVNTSQAATLLGVTAETVRIYIRNGTLKAYRLPNGRIRINKEDVENLTQPYEHN